MISKTQCNTIETFDTVLLIYGKVNHNLVTLRDVSRVENQKWGEGE